MNTRHYTYRVIWSDEDVEFVGLCAEFPSLSWLHATMAGALEGIATAVAAAAKWFFPRTVTDGGARL